MFVDSEDHDDRFPLSISVKQEETRVDSNITVPLVVRRDGRVMCRTNQREVDLDATEVIDLKSSSLTLIISTNSVKTSSVKLSVFLKKKDSDWQTIQNKK